MGRGETGPERPAEWRIFVVTSVSSILGCSGHCREDGQFRITTDINLGLRDVDHEKEV